MSIAAKHTEQGEQVVKALKEVYDPEIGLNVVDLGLIYHVDLDVEQHMVHVEMTLTTQYCPMGESIVENVHRAVQEVFAEYEINVTLTFDPPWDVEMITDEGRAFLQGDY